MPRSHHRLRIEQSTRIIIAEVDTSTEFGESESESNQLLGLIRLDFDSVGGPSILLIPVE